MGDDDEVCDEGASLDGSESDFLRVRLEMLQDALPGIAIHMHGVLGSFIEAGFAIEHAFDLTQCTYERMLSEFGF